MTPSEHPEPVAPGRRKARRTALVLGMIAVAIYAAFIVAGVVQR